MLPNYPRKPGSVRSPGLRSRTLSSSFSLSFSLSVAFTSALGLAACGATDSVGGFAAAGGSGGFGATPGGVKSVGTARELIKNGQVPPPDSFLVEAMFSEHDLPLDGAPCTDALCLRAAAGIAPTLDAQPAGWTQISLSSAIDPATYQRPALTAIFCVDISGSMGWQSRGTATDYPTSGRLSYLLLQQLAAQLGPKDRVAMVTYGDQPEQALALTPGGNPAVLSAIERLSSGGSTNMEAGLQSAYALAQSAGHTTSEVRIFLFTDENPNVGITSPTQFSQMVADGAKAGTSLTIFGMGLGVRQDLMNEMAYLRGANAYTLAKETDVPKLMSDSWPWMASAIAYDLKVSLTPASGFSLANTYGFPAAAGSTAVLAASTVFLSHNKGALLLQLAPATGVAVTSLALRGSLSFTRPDGTPVSQPLAVDAAGATVDARGQYFAQASVGKSVALAVLVTAMKDAATLYGSDHPAAVAKMTAALTRITDDNQTLADPAIGPEIQLAADLLALMQKNAPQGNLYGAGT